MNRLLIALLGLLMSALVQAGELSGPAPQFTLQSFDGKKVSLKDLKGQIVMVNFWASWCGPCRQEMPLLDEIYKKYKKVGFTLVGINLDEDKSDALGFMKKVPVSFPILHDPEGKVADAYKNQAMPSSYFIDAKGNLAYLHRGYRPGEEKEYEKAIMRLMK